MKLKSTLVGGLLCVASLGLQAQNAVEMPNVTIFGNTPGITEPNGELYSPVTRFTEFIGMDVFNFQNERLGEIKTITADLGNARVVEVFISSGSGRFWGPGELVTPVPPTALSFDGRREIARLNVSKARFDAAAKIRASDVAVYSQPERVAAASRYFGREPWFAYSGQKARPRLGYVQTTDAIHRMSIKNPQGRYMGKVGTLVMNLPRGQITQVVNSTPAMGGAGHHLLQPRALSYNARYDGLVLNQTFQQLKDQPKLVWADGRVDSYVTETNASQNAQARPATTMMGRLPAPYLSSPRPIEIRKAKPAR